MQDITSDNETEAAIDNRQDAEARITELRNLILGPADATGDDITNQTISRRRASAFAKRLSDDELDIRLFTIRGAGAQDPVVLETDDHDRALNRRVTFTVRSSPR